MRYLTLLFASAAMFAACTQPATVPADKAKEVPYEVVGSQGIMHFVVVPPASAIDQAGLRRVAKKICGIESHCQVKFWLYASQAARSLPMTDEQVNTIFAAYGINRTNGLDGFLCHPFGQPGEQCAGI